MVANTTKLKLAHAMPDLDVIRHTLALWFEPQQVVELRAFDVPDGGRWKIKTASGFYNDHDKLARDAFDLSRRGAEGVYITANRIDPDLLARRANRWDKADSGDATADKNVVRRQKLLIDCDAERITKISSNDEQHAAAIERARSIHDALMARGWPAGIFADSGNGGHVVYQIDLPPDDDGLVKRCVEALQQEFGGDGIKIDGTVASTARVWKLYGTVARKGEDVPDRPHRLANIIEAPDELATVPIELLEELAATVPPAVESKPKATSKPKGSRGQKYDVSGFIANNGFGVFRETAKSFNKMGPGTMYELKRCPWDESHADGDAWIFQANGGAIAHGCHHDSCSGKKWADLRAKFDPKPERTHDDEQVASWFERQEGAMPASAADPVDEDPAEDAEESRILDSKAPLDIARAFVFDRHRRGDLRLLHFCKGDPYRWTGWGYDAVEVADLRAVLYPWLDKSRRLESRGVGENREDVEVPFKPKPRDCDAVIDALKAVCHMSTLPPAWIGQRDDDPDPSSLIVARNGWIDPTIEHPTLHKPDPRLFTTATLDFDIDPKAPPPKAWLAFLKSLDMSPDEQLVLREFMGYLLTADTSQQKALMLIGPRRSGKGTILRVMTQLVGVANTASPTLGSLGTNFGLSPLLNKRLATITDARLSGRTDQAVVTERLLSITGEDAQTVDRKHRDPVTVKLDARFVIATNELPRLADSSGALSGRLLILPLRKSFYGVEDTALTDRLTAELPGVLLWALEGLKSLHDRGYFMQPKRGGAMQADMDDLASPVGAFVRDCCDVGPGLEVPCGELFGKWREWCNEQGRDKPGTLQTFGRDLRAVVPGVTTTNRRTDYGRSRYYEGICDAGGVN